MHVVVTAGHVDHGKSTLVDALTGMRSDRLDEERRRGLSIELGYVWTALPGVGEVAFVDVPGHERFITTALSGIGAVPVVLLVVAADDPWMPQAAEHLAALDALGVRHGVVAVTRSDLADPAGAIDRATAEVGRTSLAGAPVVAVSARTGAGLDDLRRHLGAVLGALPTADPKDDVRFWVDRRFTVKGTGTVVTGTLAAGCVARGDELVTATDSVRVRSVQSLGREVRSATGVARVALNIVGRTGAIDRGSVLVAPDAWWHTDLVDVRVRAAPSGESRFPAHLQVHIGGSTTPARVRPLAGASPDLVRLRLHRSLPLRVGDRMLLRDPGSRALWGARVLDPAPPPLTRRGAGAARAHQLADATGQADPAAEIARRGLVDETTLRRIGAPVEDPPPAGALRAGTWWLSTERAEHLAVEVARIVDEHVAVRPLDPGVTVAALARQLGLPSTAVMAAVVPPHLQLVDGRVRPTRVAGAADLPPEVERALVQLEQDLHDAPFAAPTADRLVELGLDVRRTAAAARAGRVLRVAPGIVLLPGADRLAASWLADLPQPFTTSEARQRLGTSRRVALPLLDALDHAGLTRRHPDDRREVR